MKRIYRRKNKYMIIFLTLILFMSTCITAFGMEEKGCTIGVDFSIEGENTQGVVFKVYKIGHVESDGSMVLEEPYKDYPMVWNIETAEQLKEICDTLMGYIDRDKIECAAEGITNGEGKAEIKVEDAGIYMVAGSLFSRSNAIYSISPSLIQIDEEDTYRTIQPKYEKETKPTEDITAVKVWTGDRDEIFRPKSIEVELYKDGELYDTVELSEENGWTYTWPEMSTESTWTIVEKTVLKEYYVRVDKEENVFIVKNDFNTGLHGGDGQKDDPPGTHPENPPKQEIPYTGTMWWPVPIMAICGVVLLSAGTLTRKACGSIIVKK